MTKKIKGSGKSGYEMANFLEAKRLAKERLDVSSMIHRKKPMAIPGAPVTPGVMHFNAMLPMIVEGLLQQKLLLIQGYN